MSSRVTGFAHAHFVAPAKALLAASASAAPPVVGARVELQLLTTLKYNLKCTLLFGLAKRPDAKRLHGAVRELLLRLDVLPWNSAGAEHLAPLSAISGL